MEVSSFHPASIFTIDQPNMSLSTMDHDVDMDIDIDLGPADADEPYQGVSLLYVAHVSITRPLLITVQVITSSEVANLDTSNSEVVDPISDITSERTVPHKVYIRGVDDLTTEDIISFSHEHLTSDFPTRIEWIDDTSANLVFDNPAVAMKALDELSLGSLEYPDSISKLQLRNAKTSSTHPASKLQIRMAVFTDQKRPRAYEASRFYMMHPEHDPREKRHRSRRRDDKDQGYRRPRYGDKEQRRRRRDAQDQGFTASMYDDDVDALAARNKDVLDRRGSVSTLSSNGSRNGYRGGSYRPSRVGRKQSRGRSASPGGESNDENRHQRKRRTPPPPYNSKDPHPFPKTNSSKELFPSKKLSNVDVGSKMRDISSVTGRKELFPNKQMAVNLKKELFPLKSGTSIHRRSDAFDAADETADLFATGMSVPFVDGPSENLSTSGRSLADRITDPSGSMNGRLKRTESDSDVDLENSSKKEEFSIRGASKQVGRGFSILGLAGENSHISTARELFPQKAVGNAGKELFAEKLQGRGGRRNRAADMFG